MLDNNINKKEYPCKLTESFDRFWLAYPRRVAKKAAMKAFAAAEKRGADLENIVRAAAAYAEQQAEWKTEQRHIAHPATWLNGDRWEDFPPPVRVSDEDWEKIISLEKEKEKLRERKLREDALRRRGRL